MSKTYAVLTGDLVGSTEAGADALQNSISIVGKLASEICTWPGSADTRFTRSRGDGWQMVLAQPKDTLRAALMVQGRLRAHVKGIPTRISIAIGEVITLGTEDLSDAAGPAFTASGQGLDRMPRLQRLTIHDARQTPLLQAILSLADEVARRWTREQAEAMTLALQPGNPTLAEMAERLVISRQAVNYRLSGAGLRAIRQALTGWEDGIDPLEGA